MSTSQAREINNIKKLTILRLRNVSRKDCGIIVSDVGIGLLINIIFSWIHWQSKFPNFDQWYVFVTAVFEDEMEHEADDFEE